MKNKKSNAHPVDEPFLNNIFVSENNRIILNNAQI